jgi:hypothetical protein
MTSNMDSVYSFYNQNGAASSSQQTSTENAVDDSDVTNHKKKKAGVDLHQLMNEINASVIGPAQQAAKIRAMQK